MLTPGNIADVSMAVPLLNAVARPKRPIGDKAYDVESLRNGLKARRIKAVIPSTATRTVPFPLERAAYRRRNLVERLLCRLKNWRRVATDFIASRETTSPALHSNPLSPNGLYESPT